MGFSYAEYGESVSTTEEASVDIARFMFLFFENFPQFKGRPFHLSGESYAVRLLADSAEYTADRICQGRYLPLYGAAIYDQNSELVDSGSEPINLVSLIIGKQTLLFAPSPSELNSR